MMFYLEIQTTYPPGDEFITGSKIGCCLQLVYCPFIFHLAGLRTHLGEMGMFNSMRKLENDTQYKACKHAIYEEADQPARKAHHINRNGHENKSMQQFKTPERQV